MIINLKIRVTSFKNLAAEVGLVEALKIKKKALTTEMKEFDDLVEEIGDVEAITRLASKDVREQCTHIPEKDHPQVVEKKEFKIEQNKRNSLWWVGCFGLLAFAQIVANQAVNGNSFLLAIMLYIIFLIKGTWVTLKYRTIKSARIKLMPILTKIARIGGHTDYKYHSPYESIGEYLCGHKLFLFVTVIFPAFVGFNV